MRDRVGNALAGRRKRVIGGDGAPGPAETGPGGGPLRRAAVLVPLFDRDGEPHVLLTLRTDALRSHSGQISFPGGRQDPGDPTLLHTALRETEEEIGLEPNAVEILGELDDLVTVTDYIVSPFVGLIPWPCDFRVSELEIAEIIEAPLDAFLNPSDLRVSSRVEYRGRPHVTYFFRVGDHVVWGATAWILVQLLELAYDFVVPTEET